MEQVLKIYFLITFFFAAPEKNISCEKIPDIIKNVGEIRSDVNKVKETVSKVTI